MQVLIAIIVLGAIATWIYTATSPGFQKEYDRQLRNNERKAKTRYYKNKGRRH